MVSDFSPDIHFSGVGNPFHIMMLSDHRCEPIVNTNLQMFNLFQPNLKVNDIFDTAYFLLIN